MYVKYFIVALVYHRLVMSVAPLSLPSKEKFSSKLPANDDSYAVLASLVCSDILFNNQTFIPECEKNFLNSSDREPSSTSVPPVPKVRCIFKGSVRFEVQPSERWQLVLFIADDDVQTKSTDFVYIDYSLLSPGTVYTQIHRSLRHNYTMWSTVLDERFAPAAWREGPRITPEDGANIKPMDYSIEKKFSFSMEKNNTFTGLFNWHQNSDMDLCFDVRNSCKKSKTYETEVWTNHEMSIDGLKPNDACNIRVTGVHGSTTLKYSTPSCNDSIDCFQEIPQIMSIVATEVPYSWQWTVEVSWAKPLVIPDSYNVTIRTRTIRTIAVPGNATRAVFNDVTGQGLYNVSLVAFKGDTFAHTSRRAYFPAHGGPAWGSIWAGGLAVASVALLGAVLYRRSRKPERPLPVYIPPKLREEKGSTKSVVATKQGEDMWEIESDRVLLHEQLGEGAFGVVRRATLAPSYTNVAVKMLKDFPTLEELRSFRSEMELMKSVGAHPHVVSLVGCCSGPRPMIIAEYCSRGDLLSYLRYSWDVMVAKRNAKYYNNNIDSPDYKNDLFKWRSQPDDPRCVLNRMYDIHESCDFDLTSSDLLSFCRQIAMGMKFLADNRVVHRDLAARNVLVTADKTLKIADFGLSRDVYEENQYRQKGNGKIPVKWMALESLTRKIYTTQSDVWSFGVVIWEVVTVGASPYPEVPATRLPRLLRAGYRMPRPNNCSKQLYDLMIACWSEHPCNRPTFAELRAQLDELLNSACADQYLSLELEDDDPPPTKGYKYLKMIMRGKFEFSHNETYERPLKPPHTNRYTSPPIAAVKAQPV